MARIWDALFNEGPKILFRVALALLKLEEEALLRCDNAGEEGGGVGWWWLGLWLPKLGEEALVWCDNAGEGGAGQRT